MNKTNIISKSSVPKSNAMIQVYAQLGKNELKIINFLIFSIHSNQLDITCSFTTSIGEMNEWLKVSLKKRRLNENLQNLKCATIVCNILDKKTQEIEIHGIIDAYKIKKDNSIEIRISREYVAGVLDLKLYRNLDFETINKFESKYSILLYENIDRYLNLEMAQKDKGKSFVHQMPKLTIEEARRVFGVKQNGYARFSHFKAKAIDIAVEEINAKTPMKVSYSLFKSGTKVTHIKIHGYLSVELQGLQTWMNQRGDERFMLFDDYLFHYANEQVVGKLNGQDVKYFSKDRSFRIDSQFGEIILDYNHRSLILEQCYENRKSFKKWYDPVKFQEMLRKEKERDTAEYFKG